jgi:hypothetical protein
MKSVQLVTFPQRNTSRDLKSTDGTPKERIIQTQGDYGGESLRTPNVQSEYNGQQNYETFSFGGGSQGKRSRFRQKINPINVKIDSSNNNKNAEGQY